MTEIVCLAFCMFMVSQGLSFLFYTCIINIYVLCLSTFQGSKATFQIRVFSAVYNYRRWIWEIAGLTRFYIPFSF